MAYFIKSGIQTKQLENLQTYKAICGGRAERDIDPESDDLTKVDLIFNESGLRRRVRCIKTSDSGKHILRMHLVTFRPSLRLCGRRPDSNDQKRFGHSERRNKQESEVFDQ